MTAPGAAPSANEELSGSKKARETLSQFVARVLDQLSISAWLPSAALVLLVTFVIQLGVVLDSQAGSRPKDVLAVIGQTLGAISEIKLGGALLLIAAVVVLTIVTQAFAFEAIRALEGYWGTNRMVEWVARHRCDHYRKVCERLQKRMTKLTEVAWCRAACEIERKQQEALQRGGPLDVTPNMLSVLGARIRGYTPMVRLTKKEEAFIEDIDWREYSAPDLIRRRQNVDNRLQDFPEPRQMLPTRLGNVLRHHESATGRESVESLVQEVFDDLPLSLRVEHDEQRTRLDLYCSMTFVIALVALVAAARFATKHWPYSIGAITFGMVGVVLMYRAALASARAYGRLLLLIAKHASQAESASAGRTRRDWLRLRRGRAS